MPGSTKRRPCAICRRWFRPSPRLRGRQTVCAAEPCQRARQAANERRWKDANPGHRTKSRARSSATCDEVRRLGGGKSIPPEVRIKQGVDSRVLLAGLGESIHAQECVLAALVSVVPAAGRGKSIRARLSALHARGSTLLGGRA
jgi:hypothetical protein